jgi:transposase
MKMKLNNCELKKNTQLRLIEYFVLEVTARSAAHLLDIHPNTAALFYKKIRHIIPYHLALQASEVFDGCIELDESYFGGVRKGKRGLGAAGKVAVCGILKRGGKVYTVVVEDTKSSTLMPVITRKIAPDSIVYTDTYKSYNALDAGSFHHQRINHLTHFAKGKNHINGIENFWNQAKRVLRNYNGIHTDSFPLFFKRV